MSKAWHRSAGILVLGALIAAAVLAGGGVAEADHQLLRRPGQRLLPRLRRLPGEQRDHQRVQCRAPTVLREQPVTRGQVAVFLQRTADVVRPDLIDRPFHVFVACPATTRFAVVSAAGAFVRDIKPERRRPSSSPAQTRSASTSTCRAARGRSRSARRAAAARRPAWATSPDGRATRTPSSSPPTTFRFDVGSLTPTGGWYKFAAP